jgi:hypothetical protein
LTRIRAGLSRQQCRRGTVALLTLLSLVPAGHTFAAGVVGAGTPESCTEAAGS